MAEQDDRRGLILASGSRARRDMLQAAGLAFTVVPADVDEPTLRRDLMRSNPGILPDEIADALARAKAEAVSRDHPQALVIGSDQVLALGQELLEKPRDLADAKASLLKLRGREHRLFSAAALAREGKAVWSHGQSTSMKVRAFSDAALDEYLSRSGDNVLLSVGAYQIEGPAIQLFEVIDGDYFTILGLPLLPLLAELRSRGVLVP